VNKKLVYGRAITWSLLTRKKSLKPFGKEKVRLPAMHNLVIFSKKRKREARNYNEE